MPAFPLDAWMQRLGVEPATVSFVKVDAQGSDVEVLKGAGSLLGARRAAWQIEVDPALLSGAGTSVRELMDLIERHFSHCIDINPAAPGPRVQLTSRLADTLAYVGSEAKKTDLIAYNA